MPNYDECVQIETARCDVRGACAGDAAFDEAYPDFDVASCVAYSKEHCRTRHIEGEGWDQRDVDACVAAIMSFENDCDRLLPKGVDETEAIGQCNFIENGDAGPIHIDSVREAEDGADAGESPAESETADAGA